MVFNGSSPELRESLFSFPQGISRLEDELDFNKVLYPTEYCRAIPIRLGRFVQRHNCIIAFVGCSLAVVGFAGKTIVEQVPHRSAITVSAYEPAVTAIETDGFNPVGESVANTAQSNVVGFTQRFDKCQIDFTATVEPIITSVGDMGRMPEIDRYRPVQPADSSFVFANFNSLQKQTNYDPCNVLLK